MKPRLRQKQIAAFRLKRQHLVDSNPAALATICQNVCGIQAQVLSAAEISLWARRHELTRAEIRAALGPRRTLVRTSVMRQTLHLIAAQDFSLYINALKQSRMAALWNIMSRFGIKPQEVDALNAAVVEALRDGPLPQREVNARVKPRLGKNMRAWMAKVWSILRPALVEGLICYGPEQGNEAVFVRVDQWLPKPKPVVEATAKHLLLRRYLSVYGPATLHDFSRWSGMNIPEAQTVWKSGQEELLEVECEDGKKFIRREDEENWRELSHALRFTPPVLNLLPHFDVYLLGHVDKNHLLSAAHYKRVYRNQGWISPVILLDGRIIGIWSYTRRAQRWLLEIAPFEKFSKRLRAQIEEEAASLGKFLETRWEIKFSK